MNDAMAALLQNLDSALSPGAVLVGARAAEKAVSSWSRMGKPLAVVRPASCAEVASIMRLCAEAGIPVCPWGGKTGLVDGGQADGAVALSFERMTHLEELDVTGSTVTVQAGCILQSVCDAAEAQGLSLPVDLGARGSATVGGILATNAGGNRVIRYGMARESVLGLEVVLADGTILSSMNHLIKNNAGYDLKQLFVGSEGTLGIITRAVLRLRPKPTSQGTAFVGCSTFAQLPRLLRHVEAGLGGTLSAFEVMWSEFVELVTTAPALGRSPLSARHPYSVLIEAQGSDQERDSEKFESVLTGALDAGLMSDAAIAKSQAERNAMWALRDDISQTARNWPIFTFDVSLRIKDMESYISAVRAALHARWGGALTLTVFGHLGDGNLHLVVGVGSRSSEVKHAVERIIYAGVRDRGGSISAEHGIGLEKRDYLSWSRTPEEIEMMHRLKHMLDPKGLLNPGKVLAVEETRRPAGITLP
jgi:FAD/FMN-containing dehydrogenase